MKNRIVKKILRIILLVLVGAAVIGTFYFLWKKAQPVITVYEIVTPEKGDVETKTVATGNVEPRFEVEIKPQISGIISELKKEAGQMVQAGEIIAIIKVIPEMVQLNSAESRVNLANISLKQVEETYKRDTQLFKQGVIAQEDFDLSKANYLKAVEEKDNAQSALEIIRDGIAKNSSVASTTQIRSTITGMILDIPVKVGNSVIQANNFNDGTTIATVANMNDMIFKGNVDETEIGRIHEGMPIKLTVGAMESRSFDALLDADPDTLHALEMACHPLLPMQSGPSAVAVHDDGHMSRYVLVIVHVQNKLFAAVTDVLAPEQLRRQRFYKTGVFKTNPLKRKLCHLDGKSGRRLDQMVPVVH